MDRGQGAVVALAHRVEHGDDLVAEHLADDHPARVHPQRAAHQLGHRDRAGALGVGQPFLERDHVGVQVGELAETELERALDGDQPFRRLDLVGERPQQRGLPGVGRAGDHDVLAGADRRRQERRQVGRHGAVVDERVERDAGQPGAADRHRRPRAHPHDRGEPRPVGEPDVELRVGRVERPAGQTGVGTEGLHQLDQLVVGLRDRLRPLLASVGVADEDLVEAVDVDVLDLGVVEQRLQPADAEQRGVDAVGEALLLVRRRRRAARRGPPRGRTGRGPGRSTARANCRSSSADIGGRWLSASSRRCRETMSATSSRRSRTSCWSIS